MNPQRPTTHLSEEALQDLLIGIRTPQAEEHLAACEQCRSRVAAFRSDLALFNKASLAWSESKAERIPAIRPQMRPAPSRLAPTRPLAWSAATAALLLAAAAAWNYQQVPLIPAHPVAAEFADSPDQIAQDNQLLKNVYNAIDDQPQSPVNEFSIARSIGSSDSPAESSARTSKARTQ